MRISEGSTPGGEPHGRPQRVTVITRRLRWSEELCPGHAAPPDWSPRRLAECLEGRPSLPAGPEERLNGYGVMGLPLASGDVLGLQRWPASSVGPGYTSVWHRSPGGRWTFYSDVQESPTSRRSSGSAVDVSIVTPIHIHWSGETAFCVRMPEVCLEWRVALAATTGTRLLNALTRRLSQRALSDERVLGALGPACGTLLGAGPIALHGRMPGGQRYRVSPRRVWAVSDAGAWVAGRYLGRPSRRDDEIRLGDFRIPRRGLFAFAEAYISPAAAATR